MSNENEIKKGGISVETGHIFPIIKKWLYSDKDIFLREIVSNASDAITKYKRLISLGEVRDIDEESFRITVKLDKDAGTLTVSDNGIGIAPQHHARIFERFYRVDKSHSKKSGGTGLGLSIVKHSVQYHGGKISIQSEKNKGTAITVVLPKSE